MKAKSLFPDIEGVQTGFFVAIIGKVAISTGCNKRFQKPGFDTTPAKAVWERLQS